MKTFKNVMTLILAATLAVGVTAYAGTADVLPEDETVPRQLRVRGQMKSLPGIDGLKHEIPGLMGTPVPKSYFTKDMSSNLESGELYHSAFEMTLKEMRKDYVLVLHNDLEDGAPYPVVISVRHPDGSFKNYVAKFGKESETAFDLSEEFNMLSQSVKKKTDRKLKFVVNVMGSLPFSGEIYRDDFLLRELEITEPDNNIQEVRELRSTALPCCYTTETRKIEAWVQNNGNGVCSKAWFNIQNYSVGGDFSIRRYGRLTWYYPTIADEWHYPDTGLYGFSGYCEIGINHYTSNDCSPQIMHYTFHNQTCGEVIRRHEWRNMRELISYSGSAWCEETEGCDEGATWTITRDIPYCQ